MKSHVSSSKTVEVCPPRSGVRWRWRITVALVTDKERGKGGKSPFMKGGTGEGGDYHPKSSSPPWLPWEPPAHDIATWTARAPALTLFSPLKHCV